MVGPTQALMRGPRRTRFICLYVDGDFDDAAPDPEHCQSAAAVAVWLLTHGSPFWAGPPLRPPQVTVIGWSSASSEAGELLGVLLRDPRIRIIEVTEYASLRDLDQRCVSQLVDVLAGGLPRGR